MSSNHNLLPGLPPLEGHGGAGGSPSADDAQHGNTARQRAVPAWNPSGELPAGDPYAYDARFADTPDGGMGQIPSRPWPPTPPAGPATPAGSFTPESSGEWTSTYPVIPPGAASAGRQTAKHQAISSSTGGWAAISAMMQ